MKSVASKVAWRALPLILPLFFAMPGSAQAVYGSIFGSITDPGGVFLPRAKVVAVSVERDVRSETTSNETGNYELPHLLPGQYNIRAEAPGLTWEVTAVPVHVDQATRVDLRLRLREVTENITVSAQDVPLLKTDRADVAVTFNKRDILDVPLRLKRNFTALELLAPGTSILGFQHASSENPQGGIQIGVNGQNWSQTNYQLDGTDNRDPILGIIVINPNPEAVTEMKMTSQNFDAEFGGLAGVVSTQTQSGTNKFHGSLSPSHAGGGGGTVFVRAPGVHLASDNLWSLAGSFGGPLIKNRLFFFTDYAGDRMSRGASGTFNVPTALVRETCLDPARPFCDMSEYPRQIYDPKTGNTVAFVNNQIPAARVSPQAVALLKLLPAPNVPTASFSQNYVATGRDRFNSDRFDVRIDHIANQKLQEFGRYSFADFRRRGAPAFGDLAGGTGMFDGFPGRSLARNQSIAAGLNYAIRDNLLADMRFGFFRYHVNVFPTGYGHMLAAAAGIPNINFDNITSGLPNLAIDGQDGDDLTFGTVCNCPLFETEQQFQWVTNLTRTYRNHTFRWGVDTRYAQNLRVPSDFGRAGSMGFASSLTQAADFTSAGLGLATFLLGHVTGYGRNVSTSLDAGERQKRLFLYGQDSWRVTPKLTLNYGLRWEIYFPQYVTGKGKGGWLDVSTGEVSVAGYGHINMQGNVAPDLTNIAPRVGIAYAVNHKTVVRIGYGRSMDMGVFGTSFGHTVTQNLPVLATQVLSPPSNMNAVFSLQDGPPPAKFVIVPLSGRFRLPDQVDALALPNKVRFPTVDAWNVAVQRALTPTLSVEADYIGNKGTHVFPGDGPIYDLNQPSIQGFGTLNLYQRRPLYRRFGWTQEIRYLGSDASNHYNALQVKAEKRFSNGYQFLSHYTWSKALGYDGDYYDIDPRVNFGPSNSDRKHVFVLENVIDLPVGRKRRFLSSIPRWQDWIVGGWTLAGATTIESGLPFTPSYLSCAADIDTGPCRPNLVGKVSATGNRDQYFTTTGGIALAPFGTPGDTVGPWQRPAPGTFGSAGRNSLYGPGYANTDLDVKKSFVLKGEATLELRLWLGNVFHKLNLDNPVSCVDCLDGGKILSGNADRHFGYDLRFQF